MKPTHEWTEEELKTQLLKTDEAGIQQAYYASVFQSLILSNTPLKLVLQKWGNRTLKPLPPIWAKNISVVDRWDYLRGPVSWEDTRREWMETEWPKLQAALHK